MNIQKKQGEIWSYNPAKGVGTIIDSTDQRYFFHNSRVLVGPSEINVGMQCHFVHDTRVIVTPGKLPVAKGIEIVCQLQAMAGAETLAGQNGDGGAR